MKETKKIKKEKIIPRGKQILVIPDPKESNIRASGLVRPDSEAMEEKAKGTVEAVGSDIKDSKMKRGSRVVYSLYAGERISFNTSDKEYDYIILHDDEIIAFLE